MPNRVTTTELLTDRLQQTFATKSATTGLTQCNKRQDYSITLLAPLRNEGDRAWPPELQLLRGRVWGIRCSGFYLPIPTNENRPR